jgi:hypothetical protein
VYRAAQTSAKIPSLPMPQVIANTRPIELVFYPPERTAGSDGRRNTCLKFTRRGLES